MSHFIRPLLVGVAALNSWGDTDLSQTATIAYTDTTAKSLFVIPHPYRIIECYLDVTTVFNDSGTDLISVGFSGTQGAFMNGASGASAARVLGSASATLSGWYSATDDGLGTTVTAIYVGQNGDATTGAARITLVYAAFKANNP
jgi:hypothetical protein